MNSINSITTAKESAFRIEANNVVSAAKEIFKEYQKGNYVVSNNSDGCRNEQKICITINKMKNSNYSVNSKYKGKIEIDITDMQNPKYTLFLARSAEFRFVDLSYTNYTEYGQINNSPWKEEYEVCNCETTV